MERSVGNSSSSHAFLKPDLPSLKKSDLSLSAGISKQKDEKIATFNLLMDSSVVSFLSNHCFSDKNAPVYGLLMGSLWEAEQSAHISAFIPCEREIAALVDGKLEVSPKAKLKAYNEIHSESFASNCIGAYCSDFSANASFSANLFPPSSSQVFSILLRIFVNNRIGTATNEHGTFLSSFSAFVIKQGILCTQYKTVIRIRDVLCTSKALFTAREMVTQTMLQENERYFKALFLDKATSDADKFVLACSYERYLLDVLQGDLVPNLNALQAEMKRISTFKHLLKGMVVEKVEEFKKNFPHGSNREAEEQILKNMRELQRETSENSKNSSLDGRIQEWSEFMLAISNESKVSSGNSSSNQAKKSINAVAFQSSNSKQSASAVAEQPEKEPKKFDIKKLPPEIAAALPSLIAQVKQSESEESLPQEEEVNVNE